MNPEPLKNKILREMVIDKKKLEYAKMLWKKLPLELQTYENFELIEMFVKERKL